MLVDAFHNRVMCICMTVMLVQVQRWGGCLAIRKKWQVSNTSGKMERADQIALRQAEDLFINQHGTKRLNSKHASHHLPIQYPSRLLVL